MAMMMMEIMIIPLDERERLKYTVGPY